MLSATNSSFNMTFSPKVATYYSNGLGRDYYISKNMGGFSTVTEKIPIARNQMILHKPKLSTK